MVRSPRRADPAPGPSADRLLADGSYGPVLVRLAWHCSGTYDKETNSGGSNGATMRFAPESNHGANAGLDAARAKLEPIKAKFPQITYSDLWVRRLLHSRAHDVARSDGQLTRRDSLAPDSCRCRRHPGDGRTVRPVALGQDGRQR